MNNQVGRIESFQIRGASPLRPLPYLLTQQSTGLTTESVVPQSCAIKGFATKDHIHSKWNMIFIEGKRFRAIVQQSNHGPVNATSLSYPFWSLSGPDRKSFTAKVVTSQTLQRMVCVRKPV